MTNAFLLPIILLVIASLGVGWYWYRSALKQSVRERLEAPDNVSKSIRSNDRPFARRHRFLPWMVVGTICLLVGRFTEIPNNLLFGIFVVSGFLGAEIDAWIYRWRINKIESQLADATDVLVASITSGASLQASLSQAADFSPMPLQRELQEMVARLRLGDSPIEIFNLLHRRVPTEAFQLLSTSLSVNWSSGGELSTTLSAIGVTIRDRLAIARQIRTLSTQGTLTTISVLSVIWFMAAMMWQADPVRFGSFLQSIIGSWLLTGGLLLQGIGVAFVSRLSRPKV